MNNTTAFDPVANTNYGTEKDLGRVVAVHPVAAAYQQRAVFIAVLSFLFFLGMMFAFYIRQSALYFLLATAFLIVYVVMMFSWFTQRKSIVRVLEGGVEYKNRSLRWADIASITDDGRIVINPKQGKPIELPVTISEPAALARHIRFRSGLNDK